MLARRPATPPPGRPGSTLPITAVCVVSLFAFTALAIDLGMVMVARTECQNAADGAALAGARQLNTIDAATNNQPAAVVAADDTASQNPYLNTQFQTQAGSIATVAAWGAPPGRSLADRNQGGSGDVPTPTATGAKVSNIQVGVYRYDTGTQRFTPLFGGARNANEAYSAVRVTTTGVQPAFFGRIFGLAGMQTQALATAVHRPRDIALVLDMSGSMRYGTVWNWQTDINPGNNNTDAARNGGGSMSPDPLYPQFGHFQRYTAYNSDAAAYQSNDWRGVPAGSRPNPFYQTVPAPIAGSSEVIAPNNYTVETGGGPPAVKDFWTGTPVSGANPTQNMTRAFHQWDPPNFAPKYGGPGSPATVAGNFSGWSIDRPMPAPPSFRDQNEAVTTGVAPRMGDRWPRKRGATAVADPWAVDHANGAATSLAEFLGWTKASNAAGSTGYASGNANWPTGTGSDGRDNYTRNARRTSGSATDSSSLPDRFTGANSATADGGLTYTTTPATDNSHGLRPMPRRWDNFRDATWERNGYDLDVADYVANRPATWDPRWEIDLGADAAKPTYGQSTPTWGTGRGAAITASPTAAPVQKGATALNSPVDFPAPSGYSPTSWRPKLKPAAQRFKGYTLAPGYYGKTFWVWPPDPRCPVGEPGDSNYQPGDWRQRYFTWTPPKRNPHQPSPPSGYQWTSSPQFVPGQTTVQWQEGTWTTPGTRLIPTTTGGTTGGGSGSSSTSGGTSGGTNGGNGTPPPPPPPPPPPSRHDRNRRLAPTEVTRQAARADGTEYVSAAVAIATGTSYYANGVMPSRFGNLNRALIGWGNTVADHHNAMVIAEPHGSNDQWGFQINYPALFKWLKAPPRTLPESLRAGRVVYYTRIPDDMVMNNAATGSNEDKLFWREYIEFVFGVHEYKRDQRWLSGFEYVGWPELGGVRVRPLVNNSYIALGGDGYDGNSLTHLDEDRVLDGQNAGYDPNPLYGRMSWERWEAMSTTQRQAAVTSGIQPRYPRDLRPYMGYMDNPNRPRQHFWFGPLSMMAYLANVQIGQNSMNMWAGTVREAQAWQLKAGVASALDDIRNNHPNDAIGLAYFSSKLNTSWQVTSGYTQVAAPLGQNFARIKDSLFYPLHMVRATTYPGEPNPNANASLTLSTATNEYRPYTVGSMVDYNGKTRVPNGQDGTDPNTGLALAYNVLSPSSHASLNRTAAQRGRRGAAKIVIFETDGAPKAALNLTFNPNGPESYYAIGNPVGQGAPTATGIPTSNLFQTARDEAVKVVQQIVKPANSAAGTDSGFSTPNTPARVYALGFGDLFNYTGTPSPQAQQALDFLRDVQLAGNTLPASMAGTPGYQALPADHIMGDPDYNDRMAKLGRAFERILQSGVQVTLIE